MDVIDRGNGQAVVLVPGIQGRWEWMRPAVDALAARGRVVTFSLCGDPGSGRPLDVTQGIEAFARQIDDALDRAGLERAALCGVSLGGLIATHYAATRPERVTALVLASAPGPGWTPDLVQRVCARLGFVAAPLFVASAVWRMWPEVATARGGRFRALAWFVPHFGRVLIAPASPRRMQQRLRLWLAADRLADCRAVKAPTLVVAGEQALDRVVAPDSTGEFVTAIRGASARTFERSGHIGLITRPERFAEIVMRFVEGIEARGQGSGCGASLEVQERLRPARR
jgi:3-oxoadipate enol-lactonase